MYDAVRNHGLLDQLAEVETAYDLLALHWIRTPAIKAAHARVRELVIAQSKERLERRPDLLGLAHTRRTGLVPAGDEVLRIENDRLHGSMVAVVIGAAVIGTNNRDHQGTPGSLAN